MNDWFDLTKDNFVPYLFVLIEISIINNVNTHICKSVCNLITRHSLVLTKVQTQTHPPSQQKNITTTNYNACIEEKKCKQGLRFKKIPTHSTSTSAMVTTHISCVTNNISSIYKFI